MARLSLDNFPEPKGLSNGQKLALVVVTLGLICLVWHLVTKANEARKLAQAKMAESYEKLKIAEQEKATKEQVTTSVLGKDLADAINHITVTTIEAQNKQNTEGVTPSKDNPSA